MRSLRPRSPSIAPLWTKLKPLAGRIGTPPGRPEPARATALLPPRSARRWTIRPLAPHDSPELLALLDRHRRAAPPEWSMSDAELEEPAAFETGWADRARIVLCGDDRLAAAAEILRPDPVAPPQHHPPAWADRAKIRWLALDPQTPVDPALHWLRELRRWACARKCRSIDAFWTRSRVNCLLWGLPSPWTHIRRLLLIDGWEARAQSLLMRCDLRAVRWLELIQGGDTRWGWAQAEEGWHHLEMRGPEGDLRGESLVADCSRFSTAPEARGCGIIEWIEVAPHFRRHGLGRALLTLQLRRLLEAGRDHALLIVEEPPGGAAESPRELYARVGFHLLDLRGVHARRLVPSAPDPFAGGAPPELP